MANERMTSPSDVSPEPVSATYKSTATTAGGIAFSLVMYVIVVELLSRSGAAIEPPAVFGPLRVALFVAAGAVIFTTTIVKGVMLRNAPAEPAARLARLRIATITALAMSEIPVVSGMILALTGGARGDFYMLLAISAYMMVRHFPRRGAWEDYTRRGHTTAVR